MGKYLAIVNPDLGTNWVNLVTSRELENKYINLTVEKLYDMTKAKVPNSTRDRWLTWMTSGTAIIRSYNIPANDRDFHEWVKKETWLETLLTKSQETFDAIVLDEGITVNHGGDDLQMWLRQFKVKNRSDMFKAYEKNMSATAKVEDAFEIQKASERVCYRYFKYCLEKKYIDALPFLLQQWAKGREETSMYSAKGNHDRKGGLSEWEIRNCPWWIDFPPGKFPDEEGALFKEMTDGRLSAGDVDIDAVDDGNLRVKRRRKLALPRDSKKEVKKNIVSETTSMDHGSSAEEPQMQENEDCGIQQVERRYANVSLSLICADVSDIAATMNSTQESIFKSIREFGRKVAMEKRTYRRNKVDRNWGADVVLLDFPTNEKPTMGHLVVPEWNLCSKQVIDDSFTIATLCVDDSGFVVCFCGIKQLKILDAAAKKRNLERQRMYFMVQKTPCEVTRDAFGVFENSCYYFIVYTRIGVDVGKINSVVYSMRELNQNNNVLFNVLAEKDRLPVHDAKQSRYGLEKSTKVMEFILHSFCVTGGFALDLFAGTGSMMEACALKGVHYFGTEKDEVLVQSVLALRGCGAPSIDLDKSDESGDEDDIENVPVQDVDEPLD